MVNSKSLLMNLSLGFGALLVATSALAAGPTLTSSCSLEDGDKSEVQGTNANKRAPIASVSKVFTSLWAIQRFGPDFRYATQIMVTPLDVENKIADVHIIGTYDPYFDKERFQFMVSELNKLGITKIRTLTFDEKFVFSQIVNPANKRQILDISDNDFAWSTIFPSSPAPNSVMTGLRLSVRNLNSGYAALRAGVKKVNDVDMQPTLSMTIDDIRPVVAADFVKMPSMRHFYMRSAPMHVLVKEMNSQSNNWVAEMIFKSLGGAEPFAKFIKAELDLGPEDVLFVNGSGNRIEPEIPVKYNEATCEAVVKVIAALDDKMASHNMGLADVMAVAGENSPGSTNTTGSYNNELTSHALIAKTGSINPHIALAGLASTTDGNVYFAYNYATATRGQWRSARAKISVGVNQLFRKHDLKKVIDSQNSRFFSFDKSSVLLEKKSQNLPLRKG